MPLQTCVVGSKKKENPLELELTPTPPRLHSFGASIGSCALCQLSGTDTSTFPSALDGQSPHDMEGLFARSDFMLWSLLPACQLDISKCCCKIGILHQKLCSCCRRRTRDFICPFKKLPLIRSHGELSNLYLEEGGGKKD